MSRVITLLSDFGAADHYVAAMKGVILSINPEATLVDISHNVQPQNIAQAAFLLDSAWKYFPEGTIHLVVVDPGVGSERKTVILQHPQGLFVAPDNGVLSYVLAECAPKGKLRPGTKAVSLSNRKLGMPMVSPTFHGRDIMAPAAAFLSMGAPIEELGDPVERLVTIPIPRPLRKRNALIGHVIHIDSFGNLITDVRNADVPSRNMSIEVLGHRIEGLVEYYAQKDGLVALFGSSDRLEIAFANGSAAAFTGAKVGYKVIVVDAAS